MLCEKFASLPEVSLATIKRLNQLFFAFCITCCLYEDVARKSGGCVHDPIIVNSSGK